MSDKLAEMIAETKVGLNLVDDEEFGLNLQVVANVAADVVKKTLGPFAKTTVLDDGAFIYPTKDGYSVLSRLRFSDPVQQSIFRMLNQIPFRIVDKVGDGTTTAMVTAAYFINKFRETEELLNYRQTEIIDTMKGIQSMMISELRNSAVSISGDDTYESVYNVAKVSSNGNETLARIVQDIYKQTNNPNILVDMNGNENGVSYEIQEGYRLDCSVLMKERYINTSEGYYSTGGHPHLFIIFNHNVTYNMHSNMINACLTTMRARSAHTGVGHSLVIMAPYFDDIISATISTAVNTMLQKNPNSIPDVMLVQVPELSRMQQRKFLSDFAAAGDLPITDATKVKVYEQLRHNAMAGETEQIHDPTLDIPEYENLTIQDLINTCLGTVTDATFGKNFVTIDKINTESVRYKSALASAKEDLEEATKKSSGASTTLMKDLMEAQDRMNRLSGKLGIIHVGGGSDLERKCTMDSVDDTFRACRSAYTDGIVPGMNMASIQALRECENTVEYNYGKLGALLWKVLIDSYYATTSDIIANGYRTLNSIRHNDTLMTPLEFAHEISDLIWIDKIGSYDLVTGRTSSPGVITVCNSVETDIEILNAIMSVLNLILTSDQYLSVARYYDKTAAMKAQSIQNKKELEEKISTAVDVVLDKLHIFGH